MSNNLILTILCLLSFNYVMGQDEIEQDKKGFLSYIESIDGEKYSRGEIESVIFVIQGYKEDQEEYEIDHIELKSGSTIEADEIQEAVFSLPKSFKENAKSDVPAIIKLERATKQLKKCHEARGGCSGGG